MRLSRWDRPTAPVPPVGLAIRTTSTPRMLRIPSLVGGSSSAASGGRRTPTRVLAVAVWKSLLGPARWEAAAPEVHSPGASAGSTSATLGMRLPMASHPQLLLQPDSNSRTVRRCRPRRPTFVTVSGSSSTRRLRLRDETMSRGSSCSTRTATSSALPRPRQFRRMHALPVTCDAAAGDKNPRLEQRPHPRTGSPG